MPAVGPRLAEQALFSLADWKPSLQLGHLSVLEP